MNKNSPQVRILKVLIDKGGEADSKTIAKETGYDQRKISSLARHLVNRWLVKKRYQDNPRTRTIAIYMIQKNQNERVLKILKKAFEENTQGEYNEPTAQ